MPKGTIARHSSSRPVGDTVKDPFSTYLAKTDYQIAAPNNAFNPPTKSTKLSSSNQLDQLQLIPKQYQKHTGSAKLPAFRDYGAKGIGCQEMLDQWQRMGNYIYMVNRWVAHEFPGLLIPAVRTEEDCKDNFICIMSLRLLTTSVPGLLYG